MSCSDSVFSSSGSCSPVLAAFTDDVYYTWRPRKAFCRVMRSVNIDAAAATDSSHSRVFLYSARVRTLNS